MQPHLPLTLALMGAGCQPYDEASTPKGLYPVSATFDGVTTTEYLLVADHIFGLELVGGKTSKESGCPMLSSGGPGDPELCVFDMGAGLTLTLYVTIDRSDLRFSAHRADPVEIKPPGPPPVPAAARPSDAELLRFERNQPNKRERYVLLTGPELGELLLGPERMARCTGEPGAPPEEAACAYALDPCTSVWVGVGKQVQVQFLPGLDCPKPFRLL